MPVAEDGGIAGIQHGHPGRGKVALIEALSEILHNGREAGNYCSVTVLGQGGLVSKPHRPYSNRFQDLALQDALGEATFRPEVVLAPDRNS